MDNAPGTPPGPSGSRSVLVHLLAANGGSIGWRIGRVFEVCSRCEKSSSAVTSARALPFAKNRFKNGFDALDIGLLDFLDVIELTLIQAILVLLVGSPIVDSILPFLVDDGDIARRQAGDGGTPPDS